MIHSGLVDEGNGKSLIIIDVGRSILIANLS